MTSLRSGSASDVGKVRSVNEDALLVHERIFAVADGMGGAAGGEVASRVAVEALRANTNADLTVENVLEAMRIANRQVWDRSEEDARLRGMGTTLCAVAMVRGSTDGAETILVANVGDSRVYLFHQGDLEQITDDHSLVADLVREGQLSAEEALVHPQRNIITRVLGMEPEIDIDSWEVDPYRGDRFVLCSDGLFNEVEDARIAGVLRRLADPSDAAAELVRLANRAGGRDNITVVVVDVVDDDERAAAASVALAGEASAKARPGTVESDEEPPAKSIKKKATGQAIEARPTKAKQRAITWRSVLFVAVVLAVLGGSAGAVAWFARSTYYVGVEGDQVVIFQGRPGGVLWLDPTVAEVTDLTLDDVPASRVSDLEEGKEEPSLAAARQYVVNLEEQFQDEQAATTTSSTTSTTSVTTTSLPTTTSTTTASSASTTSP